MKTFSIFLLVTGLFNLPSRLFASESLEYLLLNATDTQGASPLSFNTSAVNLKGNAFSFAELLRQKDIKFTQDANGTEILSKTSASETIRAAEFLSSGGGITFGGGVNYSLLEHQSNNDQSGNFQQTPLLESFKRAEARGKVSLELSKDFRLGAIVRYRYLEADVLGNYFIPLNERTRYSGGLIGAGASAQFNTTSAGIAVQYLSPIQGKVEILGENKVTSEPGSLSACGHVSLFTSASFGGCYILANHTQDELRNPTTGPNPANNQQILVKGVHRESNLFHYSTVAAGTSVQFGSEFGAKITGFLEEYHIVTNPDNFPTAEDDEADKVKGYRGRLSLNLTKGAVFVELGADYAQREHQFESNNNQPQDKLSTVETNFFGTLSVTL